MKQLIILSFLLFNITIGYSADYTKIDKQSKSVPQNYKSAGKIAQYLTKNLTSPNDKARAIYIWIAYNINYDLDKMNSNATYYDSKEIVEEALLNRSGVCQHYAELFQAFCNAAGVESYVITGYTSQNKKVIPLGHAWNAIKVGRQFYCIDVTWAAGYVKDGKYVHKFRDDYFMKLPGDFITTHIPFDPIWQFSNNPITHKEFDKSDFSKTKTSAHYNFADSITALPTLSKLEVLKHENDRIKENGLSNRLVKEEVSHKTKEIENVQFSNVAEKHNKAVDLFNRSIADFNLYASYRNKNAEITTDNAEVLFGFLSASQKKLLAAQNIILGLNSKNASLNRRIRDLRKNLAKQLENIEDVVAFVKLYLKSSKSEE